MPRQYRHSPLQTHVTGAPKEFRVLKVHGGSPGTPLRCDISHWPLPQTVDEDASVEYEALSWTWGEEDDFQSINIVCDNEEKEFPIRPNLKAALKHLRHPSEPRYLWVDFVCIDQANLTERAAQVKLMFYIYSKAFNVCIWLGEHKDESAVAVKFVKGEVNDLSKWIKSTAEPNKDKWTALAALMDRPWFSRRWVVQELALAKKASVHCSNDEMDWPEFETAVSLFAREASRLSGYHKGSPEADFDHDFFGDVQHMGATRLVNLKSNLFRTDETGRITEYRASLAELVSSLWSFDAQDPHDLIYAILSIAKDTRGKVNIPPPERQPNLELSNADRQRATSVLRALRHATINRPVFSVDYKQDFFLVCKQFLEHVIPHTEHHNLDIILRPWSPFKDRNGKRISLPSWIPTVERAPFKRQKVTGYYAPGGFRMKRLNPDPLVGQSTEGSRASPYNASGVRKATSRDWELFEGADEQGRDRSLIVTGFVLDKIEKLEDASQHGSVPEDWLVLGGWKDEHGTHLEQSDMLWRTVVADRGPNGMTTRPYYRKAFDQAIFDSVEGISTDTVEKRGHPILLEFLNRMKAVVTNRRLFRSKRSPSEDRGNLGLAPKAAQIGDHICIIRGMSVPVILRPTEEPERKTYRLIGECYLHTMMDGRAIEVQEKRQKSLEETVATQASVVDDLKRIVDSGNATDQQRRHLHQHEQVLRTDREELDLISAQRFELR